MLPFTFSMTGHPKFETVFFRCFHASSTVTMETLYRVSKSNREEAGKLPAHRQSAAPLPRKLRHRMHTRKPGGWGGVAK